MTIAGQYPAIAQPDLQVTIQAWDQAPRRLIPPLDGCLQVWLCDGRLLSRDGCHLALPAVS